MFQLLKGVKWFEWVLVGALAIVALAGYEVYKNYDALKVKYAVTRQANQASQEVIQRQDAAAKITDQSLAHYTQEKTQTQADNVTSRQEAIDEYLEHIPQQAPAVADGAIDQAKAPVAKAQVPASSVSRVAKAPAQPRPASHADVDPDAANLQLLAQRMHERYCRAYANGRACHAQ